MSEYSLIIGRRKLLWLENLTPKNESCFSAPRSKLFAQHGVNHTSTDAIAKEAGTAAGTLFLYFSTKQELIDTLVLQISKEQAGFIEAQLDLNLSAQENFRSSGKDRLVGFGEI